jgi:hypothetical protein
MTNRATRRDFFATLTVIIITLMALTGGWIIKNIVQDDARHATLNGYTVLLPRDWVLAPSQAPERLWAWNKRAPHEKMRLSEIPSTADTPLATIAWQRNLAQGQRLNTYHVLEESAVLVEGRTGYKVSFAYVLAGASNEVPIVITGVDYYFSHPSHTATLVFTAEAPHGNLPNLLPQFQRFLLSVPVAEGGAQ